MKKKEKKYKYNREREEKEKKEKEAKIYSVDQSSVRQEEKKKQEKRMFDWWKNAHEQEEELKRKKVKDIVNSYEENDLEEDNIEDNENDNNLSRSNSYKSNWAQNLEDEELRKGKELEDIAKKREEKEKAMKERKRKYEKEIKENEIKEKMLKSENKIGTPAEIGDLHEQSDWSWEDSEEDWSGTVRRQEKNKEKRKKRYLRKKEIIAATTKSASLIIGLHPIRKTPLDYFSKKTKNYNDAKIMAAKEYLENVIMFDKDEIEDVNITDTQVSKKGDDVMYVAVNSPETISEIHKRIAERQNPEIFARNFIPPQYFERYCALNRLCRNMRDVDTELKTQLRFRKMDIDILTKQRGSEEPFKIFKVDEKVMETIPKFDFSVRWVWKEEKIPRRKLNPLTGHVNVPSMQKSTPQNQSPGRSAPNCQSSEKSPKSQEPKSCVRQRSKDSYDGEKIKKHKNNKHNTGDEKISSSAEDMDETI